MKRPTTIRGLAWQLARIYPVRSLAIAVAVVALLAAVAARREHEDASVEQCRFEQTWFQGDLHFSQELEFDRDGTGVWTTGGMDSDAPHKRMTFRWQRDGATLTAVSGRESRTVGYEIERRDDLCLLWFDDVFLPDEQQSRHYSNHR